MKAGVTDPISKNQKLIQMKIKFIAAIIFLSVANTSFAQKALPIQVSDYLKRIPSLDSSVKSFKTCTIDSSSDGVVAIKNSGAAISSIQNDMEKYMKEAVNSTMTNSYSNASVPSQDQINQMVQNATQMKNMSPDELKQMSRSNQHQATPPSANTVPLMKEVGTGQTAASKLSVLTGELATKAANLGGEYDQQMKMLGEVKNNCVEYKVQGADLALPRCGCVMQVYLDYYQKRLGLTDKYLQKANGLVQSYLPKMEEQMAIIDKVEADTNYGDAVPVPALKTQVSGIQRQAMSSLTPVLGITDQWLTKSAKEYANVVNTQNGHVPVPCN